MTVAGLLILYHARWILPVLPLYFYCTGVLPLYFYYTGVLPLYVYYNVALIY